MTGLGVFKIPRPESQKCLQVKELSGAPLVPLEEVLKVWWVGWVNARYTLAKTGCFQEVLQG